MPVRQDFSVEQLKVLKNNIWPSKIEVNMLTFKASLQNKYVITMRKIMRLKNLQKAAGSFKVLEFKISFTERRIRLEWI